MKKFHPVWRAFITDKSSFIASLAGRVLFRLHFIAWYSRLKLVQLRNLTVVEYQVFAGFVSGTDKDRKFSVQRKSFLPNLKIMQFR